MLSTVYTVLHALNFHISKHTTVIADNRIDRYDVQCMVVEKKLKDFEEGLGM